jgi:cation diffusion facilitator family transporter
MAQAHPTAQDVERRQARRLLIVLVVIAMFFVVELAGAKAAQSDVLEADAYHLLMDVFALGVSLAALRLASARPNPRFTFGLRRAEPLAGAFNGVLVVVLCIELVKDGIHDLRGATEPKAGIMLIVASAALVVNGLSAWLLHGAMGHAGHAHGDSHSDHDHEHDHDHHHDDPDDAHAHGHAHHGHHLNVRGAWLHLIGDALGSLAAFAAGLGIRFGAPPIVDPIASFLVVAILLVGAVRLLRDAGLVLLEAAPKRVAVERVRKEIRAYPGVKEVHALHIWSLGTGHDAITAHVVGDCDDPALGPKLSEKLRERFSVEYVTVQVEPAEPCAKD